MLEVKRLLWEDLQYSIDYWLGHIYYNNGNFDECFNHWKIYYENISNAFDASEKKISKITSFLKAYQTLGNSINMFKRNILTSKEENIKWRLNQKIDIDKVKDYIYDLKLIKELVPNITDNFDVFYLFLKGQIYFYVESKIF